MKPSEFWNNKLSDNILYTQMQLLNILDARRQQIDLLEIVTDKIILSNPMAYKKPKNIRLMEKFKKLFPKKDQTLDEQVQILMSMVEKDRNKKY